MEFSIDTTRVTILADSFGATLRQVERAEVRALNKMLRWVRTHAVRSVSREAKVAAKIVRQRIRDFKASRAHRRGRVWAGLRPIAVHRLGRVKQLKRGGVRAGRHRFDDAFVVNHSSAKVTVFRRTGEAKRKMTRGRYADSKALREPVERVELKLDMDAVTDALEKLFNQAQQRFFELFAQELKYEVFVKNARRTA